MKPRKDSECASSSIGSAHQCEGVDGALDEDGKVMVTAVEEAVEEANFEDLVRVALFNVYDS